MFKLKHFVRRHWLLVSGFILSAILAVWFSFTLLADAIYFNDPRHKDEQLKAWMTPRYIGLSYELPRSTILEIFELSGGHAGRTRQMREIANAKGMTLDELTLFVRNAAEAYRSSAE